MGWFTVTNYNIVHHVPNLDSYPGTLQWYHSNAVGRVESSQYWAWHLIHCETRGLTRTPSLIPAAEHLERDRSCVPGFIGTRRFSPKHLSNTHRCSIFYTSRHATLPACQTCSVTVRPGFTFQNCYSRLSSPHASSFTAVVAAARLESTRVTTAKLARVRGRRPPLRPPAGIHWHPAHELKRCPILFIPGKFLVQCCGAVHA